MQTVGTGTAADGAAAPPAPAGAGGLARTPRPYVSFEYVCKICFKTFKSGHALGGHQNLHRNDEQREVGKYCGLTFGFEDRSQRNAVAIAGATPQETKQGRVRVQPLPHPQPRGAAAAGGQTSGAGDAGIVGQDSILAMARPRARPGARLNNNQQAAPARPPIAPIPMVQPGSAGTETGPGAVYEPDIPPAWAMRNPQLGGQTQTQTQTEPNGYSVVGDNFSTPLLWINGFINRRMAEGGSRLHRYHPYYVNNRQPAGGGEALQPPPPPPYGGRGCSAATLISECGSVEVSSHPNNGLDLELKL